MKTQKTKTEILKTEILKSGFQISAFQRFGVSAFRCSMFPFFRRHSLLLLFIFLFAGALTASAQTNLTTGFGPVQITLGSNNGPQDVDSGIKILFFMTLLSLAPSIMLLMTCFTRVAIVLSFVRSALQLQGTPANQIIIGLSLFITYFVMAPTWENISRDAIAPYQAKQISGQQALDRASGHIRTFMLKQTRPKDVELFVAMAKMEPTSVDQLPLRVVIPGFIISELRTAFQMGFLIFVPFILIDLVVATVLMSMGMMMMPPMTISMPLKLLLFVLVDGWSLVVQSLVRSFGM
jgi:flagellar biosynthesis protein FliP